MAVNGLDKKEVSVSITLVSYRSLCKLAEQRGMTPNQYIRSIIISHLQKMEMPIYYDPDGEQSDL